jgi:tripartite-type tricarboxylate transporter receptor subunit TctC
VPGYEAGGWLGFGTTNGTPPDVIARLNQAINATLTDPDTKARLASLGDTTTPDTTAAFATMLHQEVDKWGGVIREANIKIEQ